MRGSGRVTSERRSVADFDRLSVAGAFEVELRQGSVEGVELTGDDDLLPLVETVVEGRDGARTLRIAPRRDVDLQPSQPIRIRIDLVRLSSIALAGGSRLKASGLRTGKLALSIGGSGDIALAGARGRAAGRQHRRQRPGRGRRPQPRGGAQHRRQRPRRCSPASPPTTSRSPSPAAARPTSAPSAG